MATKKKNQKMDPQLVSGKQSWELKDVCRIWKTVDEQFLKVADLKKIMKELAEKRKNYKPGQLCRSRALIYKELISIGYHRVPRPKKKK